MKYVLLKTEEEERLLLEILEALGPYQDSPNERQAKRSLFASKLWDRITDSGHDRVLNA